MSGHLVHLLIAHGVAAARQGARWGLAAAGLPLWRRAAAGARGYSSADDGGGGGSGVAEAAAPAEPAAAGAGRVLRQSCKVAGRQWTFETGRLANLAHSSCLVTVEGTSVLCTAVVDATPQLEADGVPLQVEYRERLSAAGRIPTRPDRRERSGADREVLAGRLVDRALRPLLPPGFLYDTQVWCQVLSADGAVDPEVAAVNAASAALLLAKEIPFTHPVGAVKVGIRRTRGGAAVFNPSVAQQADGQLQLSLTYAGSPAKATAIEATAHQVANATFVRAMKLAAQATRPLIQAQLALAAAAHGGGGGASGPGSPAAALAAALVAQQREQLPLLWPSQHISAAVRQLMERPLQQLFGAHEPGQQAGNAEAKEGKKSRAAALTALQRRLLADLQRMGLLPDEQVLMRADGLAAVPPGAGMGTKAEALQAFDLLQGHVMRERLLQGAPRVDGRRLNELRPVSCEAGPLPRVVHGSALFNRGETQSLATATVGHDRDVAQVESPFMRSVADRENPTSRLHLHYAFPPFSVGEQGKAGAPNRREVGHGNLARAALLPLLPPPEEFPFATRVTADTLASSGSSSMAAVCSGSLALRVAGVPMKAMAAGISVGLVTARPPQLQGPGQQQQQQQQQQEDGEAGPALGYSAYVAHSGLAGQVGAASQGAQVGAEQQEQLDGGESGGERSEGSESDEGAGEGQPAAAGGPGEAGAGVGAGAQRSLESSYGPAVLLVDIQGIEDHHGDMDFKVAGTARGITAAQLDTKLPGVDLHLLEAALAPAAAARGELLRRMGAAAAAHEASLDARHAPQHGTHTLMKELVPRLIGPQGSTLLEIEDSCGAALVVDDAGAVSLYAPTAARFQAALSAVQEVEGRGLQAGQVYRVRVLRVVDFGAYVSLPNGLPALLHISELSHSRVRDVRDVVAEGQELDVLCKGRDPKGFVRLSLKDITPAPAEAAGGGGGGGGSGSGAAVATAGDGGAGGAEDRPEGGRKRGSGGGGGGGGRAPGASTWRPAPAEERAQQKQGATPAGGGGGS